MLPFRLHLVLELPRHYLKFLTLSVFMVWQANEAFLYALTAGATGLAGGTGS